MDLEGIPENDSKVTYKHFGCSEIFWESFYPYLIGIVVLICELGALLWLGMPSREDDFLLAISKGIDGMLSFASIMAGFAATLVGILFSIRQTRKIKLLEETGHFNILKRYLYESVIVNLLLSAACILTGFLMPFSDFTVICWLTSATVALFTAAGLVVFRVIALMCKLL